jgi:hypothetical protein
MEEFEFEIGTYVKYNDVEYNESGTIIKTTIKYGIVIEKNYSYNSYYIDVFFGDETYSYIRTIDEKYLCEINEDEIHNIKIINLNTKINESNIIQLQLKNCERCIYLICNNIKYIFDNINALKYVKILNFILKTKDIIYLKIFKYNTQYISYATCSFYDTLDIYYRCLSINNFIDIEYINNELNSEKKFLIINDVIINKKYINQLTFNEK